MIHPDVIKTLMDALTFDTLRKDVKDLTDTERLAIAYMAGCELIEKIENGVARVRTRDMIVIDKCPHGNFTVYVRKHDA